MGFINNHKVAGKSRSGYKTCELDCPRVGRLNVGVLCGITVMGGSSFYSEHREYIKYLCVLYIFMLRTRCSLDAGLHAKK